MKNCRKVNCRREEIFFIKHNRKMYIFAQKIETRIMLQTSISRPRTYTFWGFLLFVLCCSSICSAQSQTEQNIYLPKDSLLREADSLWALKLYKEAVPVYEKATWSIEEEDAETFIAQKSASKQVQAAYLLGLLYRNNFRYFDLQKSVDQMIIAGKQRYKPALEMLADYYVNLKISSNKEAEVLSLLQKSLAAGDTFLAKPLQQRKDFDQKLLKKPSPSTGYGCFGEEFPEFPGGNDSLSTFLQKEIHNVASKAHPGTVLVDFVVEKDGSIRNASVKWSNAPDCDQEALRGVLLMPRWKPGHNQGIYVKFFYQVPITFKGEKEQDLASGDLLFVRSKESDMEKAISASTGEYTHVALVEKMNGYTFVIEADRQEGVRRINFYEWEQEYADQYDVFRLTQPFDTADVISRAKRFLWKPYDNAFLPDNDKLYCSELIYECFWKNGEHLFEAKPMNWRDAEGNIPWYWIEHFQKLGVPVPEAVLGTNPTDMARSPLLQKVGN